MTAAASAPPTLTKTQRRDLDWLAGRELGASSWEFGSTTVHVLCERGYAERFKGERCTLVRITEAGRAYLVAHPWGQS